MQLKQHLCNI